jgi:hypothetical protein
LNNNCSINNCSINDCLIHYGCSNYDCSIIDNCQRLTQGEEGRGYLMDPVANL